MNDELSLTIETSGMTGSIAVGLGEKLIEWQFLSAPLKHSSETLPVIDNIFKNNNFKPEDIETIYVSAGPGSFTGIRIAVTMAKTLAYAVNAKIVSVPSLEAQALNALDAIQDGHNISNIGVILEAGRGNVFAGCYTYTPNNSDDTITSLVPNFTISLEPVMEKPYDALSKMPKPLHLLGEGINYHKEELSGNNITILDNTYYAPSAVNVFECGKKRAKANLFASPESFVPIYMRKPEAELKWEELKK